MYAKKRIWSEKLIYKGSKRNWGIKIAERVWNWINKWKKKYGFFFVYSSVGCIENGMERGITRDKNAHIQWTKWNKYSLLCMWRFWTWGATQPIYTLWNFLFVSIIQWHKRHMHTHKLTDWVNERMRRESCKCGAHIYKPPIQSNDKH